VPADVADVDSAGVGGGAVERLAGSTAVTRPADVAGHLLDNHAGTVDQNRGQPARPFFLMQAVVPTCWRGGRHHRQRHIVGRSGGQPYLGVRGGQGRTAGLTRQRRAATGSTGSGSRLTSGWTEPRARTYAARVPRREDGWAERAAENLPMGKLGQFDEIADSWSSCFAAAACHRLVSTGIKCVRRGGLMRIGLIGLGRIGAFHAETLAALPDVEALVTDVPAASKRSPGCCPGSRSRRRPATCCAPASTVSSSRPPQRAPQLILARSRPACPRSARRPVAQHAADAARCWPGWRGR